MQNNLFKRPIITEKTTKMAKRGVYTFEVSKNANKSELEKQAKQLFNVDALKIGITVVKGKTKTSLVNRRKEYKKSEVKKALIKVKPGQKIGLFEVVEEKGKKKK